MALKDRIRKQLNNYRADRPAIDTSLPRNSTGEKSVAVIGGGIAGISAAANLAERGFKVDLYECQSFLGGKVGSWTFDSNGETLRTEHGFHAFFRQYYNLRAFMQRIGCFKHLIPIDDYLIFYDRNQRQSFKGLETTPGLNVIGLRKHGVYGIPTLINPLSAQLLNLFRFHPEKTFEQFDKMSFADFAKRTMLPRKMRLVFNSFTRAFFAEPDQMSMAEMIKSFHFYFLSNDDGLVYDVLEDDFEHSFLKYCRNHLESHGAQIHLNTRVHEIQSSDGRYRINDRPYDYAVLCTDVKATRQIVDVSADLHVHQTLHRQLKALPSSGRYAVLRIWTDRFEADKELPFFIFTDRLSGLDSVSLYHKMEKESEAWSRENNGGIFELHSYCVPEALQDDEAIKTRLLEEFFHYFPEMKGMQIRHEYFQHRDDFPGFTPGAYADRPTVKTESPGLFLAGDWVKTDNCSMLMEAAYTTGAQAANHIFSSEGLQLNEIISVPTKGLLA